MGSTMATGDQRKSLRHFYCRDAHWEIFEKMASELECSVDYLINEALRHYARARSTQQKARCVGTPTEPPAPAIQRLFLIFGEERYEITAKPFTIGRGHKTADLPIKDDKISRKHATVVHRYGTFYIRDLGSTNGLHHKGQRIDNKRIDDGDCFIICGHELRFAYR